MMPKVPDPLELKPLLEKHPSYAALKKKAEAKVARWEWGTDEFYSVRPWHEPCGKLLEKPPRDKAGLWEYGFDDRDQLTVVRRYTPFKDRFMERFFFRDGDELWLYEFNADLRLKQIKPLWVGRYRLEQGRPVDYAVVKRAEAHGPEIRQYSLAETYEYEGDHLIAIHQVHSPPPTEKTLHLRYESGILATVEDGTGRIIYKHSLPKLADLLKGMREALLTKIPTLVKSYPLREPAFCLALAYSDESEHELLPPKLVLGLESDLRAWEQAKRKRELRELWNPEELGTFDDDKLELHSERVATLADDIARHLAKSGDFAPARKLLVEVSRELNKLDWGKLTKVTKSFVVYPANVEGGDYKAIMKAVVPPKTFKALQAEGLL